MSVEFELNKSEILLVGEDIVDGWKFLPYVDPCKVSTFVKRHYCMIFLKTDNKKRS